MPQVQRLDDLKIVESSGVDHPANLADGWLVMKEEGMATSLTPGPGWYYVPPSTSTNTTVTITGGSNIVVPVEKKNPNAPHPFMNKTADNGVRCDTCGKGPTAQVHMSYAEKASKTEGGKAFPAGDYAYVPDPQSPSTWKLRLTSTPGGPPDPAIVGAAAAALGPGFRGQKVQIPQAALAGVKAKVRAAWKKANPDKKPDEMPAALKAMQKEARMPPEFNRDELTPEAVAFVEDLEAQLAAASGGGATPPVVPPVVTPPAVVEPPAPVAELVDKAVPEAVRKALEDAEARAAAEVAKNADLAERIAKMERKEREAEFVAKARELPNLGGANELGALLLDVSEKVTDETFKALDRVLKAANAQMEKGALFAQLGDPAGEPGGPLEVINKLAQEKVAAGTAATIEIAKAAVLAERPDLRDQYITAQRAR